MGTAGHTARKRPWDAKLCIERSLRDGVASIAKSAGCGFAECVDALLVLTEAQYLHSVGDSLVYQLLELKGRRILDLKNIRVKPERVLCHVKLSIQAREFATLLCHRYPPVFDNANEAITLCLMHWQRCCESKEHLEYVARRLRCALDGHLE